MKLFLRAFTAFFLLLCSKLEAGNLKVSLTPSQAVTAGAQWRVDSGTWRNSDVTVNNLTNTNHTVDFRSVTGWITPAAMSVAITSGNTTAVTANYIQTASVKITLTPSNGQWRIDGGAWRTSTTTVSNLTPGNHSIEYNSVSGYATPAAESVNLSAGQALVLSRNYVQLAQLKVTLTPNTGQWRVDGGTWLASGATATNLAPGTHNVTYASLANYASPATETITLAAGQSLTLSRSYVQLAKLSVSLTPNTAQWRVDGGAWQNSGTTVASLSVGSHTINYIALTGYTAPASESVTLASGQQLSLSRSYIQLAQVSVTLSPNAGQWRVDGGAWLASGATAGNLAPGSHALSYSTLTHYVSPSNETITLTGGQSLTLSRSYTQLAQISINLVPSAGQWRANGGSWQVAGSSLDVAAGNYLIEYSVLSLYDSPPSENITLTSGGIFSATRSYVSQLPSLRITTTGQWRIDGGAWLDSGTLQSGLSVGSHTIDYTDVGGIYQPQPSETITLALRENAVLTRTYTLKPSSIQVNLDPNTAVWRISQNAYASDWQPSGAVISGLRLSNYTIEYGLVTNYDAPAAENVSVTPGQTLIVNRSYTPRAEVSVTLTPATAQWNVDGGAWQTSGVKVSDLAPGTHSVGYAAVNGFTTLPSEDITLVSGQSLAITRSYEPLAQIAITLVPGTGQWRVSGTEAWQASGTSLLVTPGDTPIEYSDVADYDSPPGETITLAAGGSFAQTRYYTSQKPTLRIHLTTAINGSWHGQWRVDGGTWQNSDATVSELSVGSHAIDYTDIGDPFLPLSSETVSLALRENAGFTRTYALRPPASLAVVLDPASAQWNVDGGAWQASGSAVGNLDYHLSHTINYAAAAGYTAPASEAVTLSSGQNLSLNRTYAPYPQLSVTLSPTYGQWRVDGGDWQASGASLKVPPGTHSLQYRGIPSYASPSSESVTLISGQILSLTRNYTALASVVVSLTPSSGQWRIDGGAWIASGSPLQNLSVGNHTLEFSFVPGYAPLPAETITLAGGNNPLSRTYTPLATFGINLDPSTAQWRLDGGAWQASGGFLTNLPLGAHTIDYAPVANYITPASETVTLVSGPNGPLVRTYTALAKLGVVLTPYTAQWRVDGGAWLPSGYVAQNLPLGTHLIEYSTVTNYVTPASETVTLVSGLNPSILHDYVAYAKFSVTLNPSIAQWRFTDGPGFWNNSGTFYTSRFGPHVIEYAPVAGYVAPASETMNLVSGDNPAFVRNYAKLASVHVTTTPTATQWRIDGGQWFTSGITTVNNLAFDVPHTIEFNDLSGYVTPPAQTITLLAGELREVTATYQKLASVHVTTTPNTTQWRIDGGQWFMSGTTTVNNLAFDVPHTVEFNDLSGYVTPPAQTITLGVGELREVTATYQKLASVHVTTTPNTTQWRIDGGQWFMSGTTTVNNLAFDVPHTVEFNDLSGYVTPPAQTITLGVGELREVTATYQKLASVHVTTTPNTTQWRIDGGQWFMSGTTTVNNLAFDVPHTIEFNDLSGYVTPPAQTITLGVGELREVTATYQKLASIHVSSNVQWSQWRVDGGTWYMSNSATVNNLAFGVPHAIEFSAIENFVTPENQTVTLSAGELREVTVNYSYGEPAQVTLNLDPAVGQWRIRPVGFLNGQTWNSSGTTISGLIPGNYLIEYTPVDGYDAPATETFQLIAGQSETLTRSYKYNPVFAVIKSFVDTGNAATAIMGSDGIIYVASSTGVSNGNGHIFRINADGSGYQEMKVFGYSVPDSLEPNFLIEGSDQVLYGTTKSYTNGTPTSKGTLYRINKDGSGFAILRIFDTTSNGLAPVCVAEGSDGFLYGATNAGGGQGYGAIFRIAKDGTNYSVIHSFIGSDGSNPQAVIEGPEGALYGTTRSGGASNLGTIFKLDKSGSNFAVLKSFATDADGASPHAGLTACSDGQLYGTTFSGGTAGYGGVFRLNSNGTNFQVVHNFLNGTADGRGVESPLIEDASGALYGTALVGGVSGKGAIFKMNKDGSAYSLIAQFTGGVSDGGTPRQRVALSSNGKLYGTTTLGGGGGFGALFNLNYDGSNFNIIRAMGSPEGAHPYSTVYEGSDGLIYGTTHSGSFKKLGNVYRLNKTGEGFAVLHEFADTTDGGIPIGFVAEGPGGMIYGTTWGNGVAVSTLYRLNKDGSNYSVIHRFDSASNGQGAWGGVTVGSDGMLYGPCLAGGTTGNGAVYRVNADGSGFTLIHSFIGGTTDGSSPNAEVIEGTDGRIYGTTYYGGSANYGTIFAMNKDGSGYTILRSFTGGTTDGCYPASRLLQASDGLLYGTTPAQVSGTSQGTIFRIATNGTSYAIIRQFTGGATDGSDPSLSGVLESKGVLFGTTAKGGTFNRGTVYSLNRDGTNFSIWVNFGAGSADGAGPFAGVIRSSDGTLFGTTGGGGGGGGTVFRLRSN